MRKGYIVLGGIVLLIIVVWFSLDTFFLKHIDSGDTGIKIGYGTNGNKPSVSTEPSNTYVWINPFLGEKIVQYPTAQQSLVLSSNTQEGELTGNSSIGCFMDGGGTINFGLTVNWQVDPAHPETLYFTRPNVDLTSSLNNDIATTTVYGAVRSATGTSCSHYSWQQILGNGTGSSELGQLQSDILTTLKADLAPDGILVNQVFINERTPDDTIHGVLNAQIAAQQSALLKVTAQNQADAKTIAATGEAKSIQIINAQLSSSPAYVNYLIAKEWDGHLPGTLVTSGGNTILAPFKNAQ